MLYIVYMLIFSTLFYRNIIFCKSPCFVNCTFSCVRSQPSHAHMHKTHTAIHPIIHSTLLQHYSFPATHTEGVVSRKLGRKHRHSVILSIERTSLLFHTEKHIDVSLSLSLCIEKLTSRFRISKCKIIQCYLFYKWF